VSRESFTHARQAAGIGVLNGAYGLSKVLLNCYTVALAREHPRVVASACMPGVVKTDIFESYRPWWVPRFFLDGLLWLLGATTPDDVRTSALLVFPCLDAVSDSSPTATFSPLCVAPLPPCCCGCMYGHVRVCRRPGLRVGCCSNPYVGAAVATDLTACAVRPTCRESLAPPSTTQRANCAPPSAPDHCGSDAPL
jgi:hypothetical protein